MLAEDGPQVKTGMCCVRIVYALPQTPQEQQQSILKHSQLLCSPVLNNFAPFRPDHDMQRHTQEGGAGITQKEQVSLQQLRKATCVVKTQARCRRRLHQC